MLSLKQTKGSTSPLLWIYLNSVLKKTRKNALTLALKRKKKKVKPIQDAFFTKLDLFKATFVVFPTGEVMFEATIQCIIFIIK